MQQIVFYFGHILVTSGPERLDNQLKMDHEVMKNLECQICHNSFGNMRKLTKHFKAVHENVKPLAWFATIHFEHKSGLNIHVKTVHENVKPFICLICKQSFKCKSHFDTHDKTVHQNIKSFTCQICNISFGYKSVLNIHVKIVHQNIKPFTCLICS